MVKRGQNPGVQPGGQRGDGSDGAPGRKCNSEEPASEEVGCGMVERGWGRCLGQGGTKGGVWGG